MRDSSLSLPVPFAAPVWKRVLPKSLRARLFASDDCLHFVRRQAVVLESTADRAAQLILNPRRASELIGELSQLEQQAKGNEAQGTLLLKTCVITPCDSDDLRTLLSRMRWSIESLHRVSACAQLHPPELGQDPAARILGRHAKLSRHIHKIIDAAFAVSAIEAFTEEYRAHDRESRRLLREAHGLLADSALPASLRLREKEILRRLAIFRGCTNQLAVSLETLHFKNN